MNLAPEVRDGIIQMVSAVDEVQSELIKTANFGNPNFLVDFKNKARKSKCNAMKRIEEKDRESENPYDIISELDKL